VGRFAAFLADCLVLVRAAVELTGVLARRGAGEAPPQAPADPGVPSTDRPALAGVVEAEGSSQPGPPVQGP